MNLAHLLTKWESIIYLGTPWPLQLLVLEKLLLKEYIAWLSLIHDNILSGIDPNLQIWFFIWRWLLACMFRTADLHVWMMHTQPKILHQRASVDKWSVGWASMDKWSIGWSFVWAAKSCQKGCLGLGWLVKSVQVFYEPCVIFLGFIRYMNMF